MKERQISPLGIKHNNIKARRILKKKKVEQKRMSKRFLRFPFVHKTRKKPEDFFLKHNKKEQKK